MVRGIHHVSMKCASLPFLPCVPGSRSAPDRWMRKSNCSVKSPINPERYSAAARFIRGGRFSFRHTACYSLSSTVSPFLLTR